MSYHPRHPFKICLSVWHALFMREAMARMTADRFGWTWILVEPVLHVIIMISVRQLLGRVRYIQGADFIPWLIVGIITFFIFRDAMLRSMSAVRSNRALFAYRQVLPIDTVIVRSLLEFCLRSVIFVILIFGMRFLGYYAAPDEPFMVIVMWFLAWGVGLSFGLVLSVFATMVEEIEKIIRLFTFPLYMLSGVLLPIKFFPYELRPWLLLNPIAHVLEMMRHAFFDGYYMIPGINPLYPIQVMLFCGLLGLMLHVRYKIRLMSA
ncbi:ABC transporter permease [Vibrio sp. V31_P5A7T61]|uniref:ABC transporter permease n=1 Tax=unclassified Vibrio TaxID=2614977 RepID=UPI001372F5ED|nr:MULTISPECIES: ABC transporter permease [unclassified Vibrio]NAW60742.1 ABC transporter permease [Vibrio sp. V31_P5A7T61]NAX01120.1 ABC transporter permease [Vibrio sp. V34_P3A8T189]NAX08511.1 ABC transporter permease [Vibrio sp. V40_P2S30T141]NAX62341.1 ABC transporter permease [Vibrio sp. V32_P6A28T40]